MALIKCPECGRDISDKAQSCPACGCPITTENHIQVNTVYFGKYPQNEPLEWIELNSVGRVTSLITRKCIAFSIYDYDTQVPVEWENSFLRKWLNTTFYNSAFSPSERNLMCNYNLKSGASDRVTLLSSSDAENAFASQEERIAGAIDFAKIHQTCDLENHNKQYPWWLRGTQLLRPLVLSNGEILNWVDSKLNDKLVGVRPVIFVLH